MQTSQSEYRSQLHQRQKELMVKWYDRLNDAAETGATPTVSMMVSGNCVELLEAFDAAPIYPEVNALQLAIRHQSLAPILVAEEMGYAADNCAYVKADIGAYVNGITPTGGKLPKPTLVLCNFVGCNTYLKWFEHVAEFTGAPLYTLDIPFMRESGVSVADVDYVVRQMKELIKLLEQLTGRKFDIDRFREAVRCSARVEELWSNIKHLTRTIPSPFDAYFDAITLMGPLYVYRAKPEGVEFFELALQEFTEKVERREGVNDQEKFRLVIEGPPPYPHFRTFRDMFAKWKAMRSCFDLLNRWWPLGVWRSSRSRSPVRVGGVHMLEHNVTNRNYLQRYEQIKKLYRGVGRGRFDHPFREKLSFFSPLVRETCATILLKPWECRPFTSNRS